MYRGILVNEDHRKFQHIFWRESPHKPLQELELNTVTYGFSSSPFLAQRTIRQLVQDEGKPYPLDSHAIMQETYVDDITSGAADISSAVVLRDELISLLDKAGFSLRKWASSHSEVLTGLPSDHIQSVIEFSDDQSGTLKVLGLEWKHESDVFTYIVSPPTLETQPTKRCMIHWDGSHSPFSLPNVLFNVHGSQAPTGTPRFLQKMLPTGTNFLLKFCRYVELKFHASITWYLLLCVQS